MHESKKLFTFSVGFFLLRFNPSPPLSSAKAFLTKNHKSNKTDTLPIFVTPSRYNLLPFVFPVWSAAITSAQWKQQDGEEKISYTTSFGIWIEWKNIVLLSYSPNSVHSPDCVNFLWDLKSPIPPIYSPYLFPQTLNPFLFNSLPHPHHPHQISSFQPTRHGGFCFGPRFCSRDVF